MDSEGPKHWARLRLLQACERLEIPEKLWPWRKAIKIPREYGMSFRVDDRLALPSFFPLYETESDWKARCRGFLEEFMDRQMSVFRRSFQSQLDNKQVTPITQKRDTTPLNLRYEWAAKRLCYRTPFKDLASGGYSAEAIKQSVGRIVREARLKDAT